MANETDFFPDDCSWLQMGQNAAKRHLLNATFGPGNWEDKQSGGQIIVDPDVLREQGLLGDIVVVTNNPCLNPDCDAILIQAQYYALRNSDGWLDPTRSDLGYMPDVCIGDCARRK